MASLGDLTRIIAAATGVNPQSVIQFVRNLRIGGAVTSHGRGRSAAKMTTRDIAVILIAMLVSDHPVDAVRAVQDCGALPRAGAGNVASPEPSIFPFTKSDGSLTDRAPKSFLDACVYVLDALVKFDEAGETRSPYVAISFDTSNFCGVIETSAAAVLYESPMALASAFDKLTSEGEEQVSAWKSLRRSYQNSKITVRRTIHFETLSEVAKAFAET